MRFREAVTLVVMCAGTFFVLLDITIVNVAPPSIGFADSGLASAALLLSARSP